MNIHSLQRVQHLRAEPLFQKIVVDKPSRDLIRHPRMSHPGGSGPERLWLWGRPALMRRQLCYRHKRSISRSLPSWRRCISQSGRSAGRSRCLYARRGRLRSIIHRTLCQSSPWWHHRPQRLQVQIGYTPEKRKSERDIGSTEAASTTLSSKNLTFSPS